MFPRIRIQTHRALIRNSVASWKDRKAVRRGAAAGVYSAASQTAAAGVLAAFEGGPWGREIPDDRAGAGARLGASDRVLWVPG